ncbi:hypothetical protein DFJ74DRAFT_329512 [Hyaloraphidium curvatum]|nr:hypothetical protein DFJ74DRAFT_329512 [Hyaloraphidium curvatum]
MSRRGSNDTSGKNATRPAPALFEGERSSARHGEDWGQPERDAVEAKATDPGARLELFPYVPPTAAGNDAPTTADEELKDLAELRLRSVSHNCRSLLELLRIGDPAELRTSIFGQASSEHGLSFQDFLRQYLSIVGSIVESCDWDLDEAGPSVARQKANEAARSTMLAIASSAEDRKLARLVWEMVQRLGGLLGEISIHEFLPVRSMVEYVQIYGPTNPAASKDLVARVLQADTDGLFRARLEDMGALLRNSLVRTVRKLGKLSIPEPPLPTSLPETADELGLENGPLGSLANLLSFVRSAARTVASIARFFPLALTRLFSGPLPDLLAIIDDAYATLSTMLEEVSALGLRTSFRGPPSSGFHRRLAAGDHVTSMPSPDSDDEVPPLEDSYPYPHADVPLAGQLAIPLSTSWAGEVQQAVAACKIALLDASFNLFRCLLWDPVVNASGEDKTSMMAVVAELVDLAGSLITGTSPTGIASYAFNAPLVLDLEIRYNLSEMLQAALAKGGWLQDPEDGAQDGSAVDLCIQAQQLVRWLHDAVTMSGNAAAKWRLAGSYSYLKEVDRRVPAAPPMHPSAKGPPSGSEAVMTEWTASGAPRGQESAPLHFSEDYIKRTSLIAQIKDLFPELGEGFIEACLIVFEDDAERVIMSILEGDLPQHLAQLDRGMPRAPRSSPVPRPADVAEQPPPYEIAARETVLDGRRNVFDGDEFDFLTRGPPDKDTLDGSVFAGKRAPVSADDALADKSFVHEMRSALLDTQYSDIEEAEDESPQYDMYDDELDDSYDVAGAPRAAQAYATGLETDDDDDESSDEEPALDPEAAREAILVEAAVSDPSAFANKKSEAAQALSKATGLTFEQLLGWKRTFDANPKKQRIIEQFQDTRMQNKPVMAAQDPAAPENSAPQARTKRDYARKEEQKSRKRQGGRDRKLMRGWGRD